ncbi:MAG: hypothetical protein DRP02_05075 [Candidatus Gerdarchaeota archaeon]|nr:MAG: hypothetical protein DRO63_04555 [Candidatus Gerdarchaeota archaeon]RLI71326.1 MAG: hypothetical protein DRP02_05075 [Candidatus Gerdarchaeota archaeon]
MIGLFSCGRRKTLLNKDKLIFFVIFLLLRSLENSFRENGAIAVQSSFESKIHSERGRTFPGRICFFNQ